MVLSMLVIDLALFLLASIVLVSSGRYIVIFLSRISAYIGMTEYVTAFIIMSVSTSLPELFVGINSALKHIPVLTMGNVIGANIINLTLVISVSALLSRGIKIKEDIKENLLFMFLLASLPIVLIWFGSSLSRLDGLILVSIFFWYVYYTIKQKRVSKVKKNVKNGVVMEFSKFMNNVVLLAFSVILLFGSSFFVVRYASSLAVNLGISEILIGLFLVSIATSLPELTFGVMSSLAKKAQMTVGDSIGSVICNSTLVLGVTALIYPISDDFILLFTSLLFMLFSIIIFIIMVRKNNAVSWRNGLLLLLVYILFILFEFYLK